jgi:hypothetical protein
MLSGRVTDKMVFVAIYTLVAMLVVIQGGRHITNYVLDTVFYNDYLMPWKLQLTAMRHQTVNWPEYVSHDPGAYMSSLVTTMRANGLAVPKSNMEQSYVYRLNKFGEKAQQILIVATREKIILFNLPPGTFDRLDDFADGRIDASAGAFTGQWSTDGITRIGYWKY